LGREDENKPFWKTITDISSYIKELEDKWKNHYNVYVYQKFPYPPKSKNNID
jgi:hypothetical protein